LRPNECADGCGSEGDSRSRPGPAIPPRRLQWRPHGRSGLHPEGPQAGEIFRPICEEVILKKPVTDKLRAGTFRDKRFVAAHRGGPLELEDHRALAKWAANCAERVLPLFEKDSDDQRPRFAVETARAWAKGTCRVGEAQRAAVAAHAAAREAQDESATAAARAAGHAAATAHTADHSLGASLYALKAVEAAQGSVDEERKWQRENLPREVRELVVFAIDRRRAAGLGNF